MKQLTPEQLELLAKPLPKEAIKDHPTMKGLSAINPIYVTERLNAVFGVGAWQTSATLIKAEPKGEKQFTALVQTEFTIPDYGIRHNIIASSTNNDLGDAAKGAVTDAITKVASWFGIGSHIWKNQPVVPEQHKPTEAIDWAKFENFYNAKYQAMTATQQREIYSIMVQQDNKRYSKALKFMEGLK